MVLLRPGILEESAEHALDHFGLQKGHSIGRYEWEAIELHSKDDEPKLGGGTDCGVDLFYRISCYSHYI